MIGKKRDMNVHLRNDKTSQTCGLVLVRAVLLLFLSLYAAAAWAQSESTQPPFPPPGRLVDVGGWRLHLNCTGEARTSQPTVILESGIGDFSVEWSLVQPGVARFARVCSYDRAGDGWSARGPRPRTMHQIVYELHTLLDKAGVKPPWCSWAILTAVGWCDSMPPPTKRTSPEWCSSKAGPTIRGACCQMANWCVRRTSRRDGRFPR